MCIDYKNLNSACPKDAYPLPEIDQKVDSLAPFRFKCFLDAYKGYHQIPMAEDGEEKTAFITDIGTFCYTKMPFGLKNAGATYQRLMDKVFEPQNGKNLEIYVDDLVIKSHDETNLLADIAETFLSLKESQIMLNPGKCSFGVEEGKFLGVMVTKEGFRANPEKVSAITRMTSPSSIKEVQALNGRLVAINRFLAKHAERSLPFIQTLKNCLNKAQFQWTDQAEEAFQQLKLYLAKLPTLMAPEEKEKLTAYIATTDADVSAVLMVERKGVQTPIYYVSRVLTDPETMYSLLEKLTLALVHASRRLRRYFQAHPVEILTNFPIQQVLKKPELSGRLAKWAVELGALSLEYKPRTALKGQVIADFLAEIPEGREIEITNDLAIAEIQTKTPQWWSLYTDGASSMEGSGAGLMLLSPEGVEITYAVKLNFKSTNNEAEYEALLAGLRLAVTMKAQHIRAHVDSLLVANQVNKIYEAKGKMMIEYLKKTKEMMLQFQECSIEHIPRSQNRKADALSKLASVQFAHLAKEIRVQTLDKPSICTEEISHLEDVGWTWMTPLMAYLKEGILPENRAEALKLRTKALQYQLVDNRLYRRTFLGPLLRCVGQKDAELLVEEVHEGSCGMHAGPRMIVAKLMNIGYYWPGMHVTAVQTLRRCLSCQKHAPKTLKPKNDLIPVTGAWPFQKWGIDIVGQFSEAPRRIKFLIAPWITLPNGWKLRQSQQLPPPRLRNLCGII
ncbi:hypothetical protein L1987_03255 [Smallanthus sonchifolius]|uniref:Uncharacterized protein n=1 Tax=Smallanthus sonchifolius TaxID=185202 RepID=A0ACB9KA42_9ASTR|nr:hypothetical protein L1987_03255 [Smallanthus sonchifolius]